MSTHEAMVSVLILDKKDQEEYSRGALNMLLCAAARSEEYIPLDELEEAAEEII